MKGEISGIFFDAGWVLFYPVYREWFLNRKIAEYIDLGLLDLLPQERKADAFDSALQYLNSRKLILTEDEEYALFQGFYGIISAKLPELNLNQDQINEIAYTKVFDTDNYAFYPDTKPALEKLKTKYKLGIISDTWPSIERILRFGGIDSLFDTKTYSCFLGVSKPDQQIYLHALQHMGFTAKQTVFIDDSENNLVGAATCGMNPILMRTERTGACDSGKYPVIDRLSDLLELDIMRD